MIRRALLLAALVVSPAAMRAQTMQPGASPAAGTFRAAGSGAPASVSFDVRAEVESGLDGCVGYVAPDAPDAVVEWAGGDLRIWGRAAFDATLLVSGPDGEWSCNDDADGIAPAVMLPGAVAGRYAVWLGAFSPDPADARATLYAGAPPPPPVLNASAPPASGTLTAVGGFEAAQGAIEVAVDAGGADAAASLDLSQAPNGPAYCTGYIDAARPTAGIDYAAGGDAGVLAIGAGSVDADLVLVVKGPDGSVYCNDDADGPDPLIAIDAPVAGLYAVWVGTFGASLETVPATLVVSETAPEFTYDDFDGFIEEPFEPTPFSEGTYTPLDLSLAPAARMTLDGDQVSTSAALRVALPNPVVGDVCSGYLEHAPTVGLTIEGDGPVAVTATSVEDLVLLMQTPSGLWFCSDDADGLNPGIQVDAPEAGVYKVWAGTFSDGTEVSDVEVVATRGELVVSGGAYGFTPDVTPQSEGAYDGSAVRPGSPQVRLGAELPASATVTAGGPVLNPVEGEVCGGFVSERPTAEVDVRGGVEIEADPLDETDLVLLVRTEDGAWACSDDAEGQAPRIHLNEASGTVSVWVGTFSRRSTPPQATLTVTSVSDGN